MKPNTEILKSIILIIILGVTMISAYAQIIGSTEPTFEGKKLIIDENFSIEFDTKNKFTEIIIGYTGKNKAIYPKFFYPIKTDSDITKIKSAPQTFSFKIKAKQTDEKLIKINNDYYFEPIFFCTSYNWTQSNTISGKITGVTTDKPAGTIEYDVLFETTDKDFIVEKGMALMCEDPIFPYINATGYNATWINQNTSNIEQDFEWGASGLTIGLNPTLNKTSTFHGHMKSDWSNYKAIGAVIMSPTTAGGAYLLSIYNLTNQSNYSVLRGGVNNVDTEESNVKFFNATCNAMFVYENANGENDNLEASFYNCNTQTTGAGIVFRVNTSKGAVADQEGMRLLESPDAKYMAITGYNSDATGADQNENLFVIIFNATDLNLTLNLNKRPLVNWSSPTLLNVNLSAYARAFGYQYGASWTNGGNFIIRARNSTGGGLPSLELMWVFNITTGQVTQSTLPAITGNVAPRLADSKCIPVTSWSNKIVCINKFSPSDNGTIDILDINGTRYGNYLVSTTASAIEAENNDMTPIDLFSENNGGETIIGFVADNDLRVSGVKMNESNLSFMGNFTNPYFVTANFAFNDITHLKFNKPQCGDSAMLTYAVSTVDVYAGSGIIWDGNELNTQFAVSKFIDLTVGNAASRDTFMWAVNESGCSSVTEGGGEPPADTCSCPHTTSILCSDNCILTDCDEQGNAVNVVGSSGSITITGKLSRIGGFFTYCPTFCYNSNGCFG